MYGECILNVSPNIAKAFRFATYMTLYPDDWDVYFMSQWI